MSRPSMLDTWNAAAIDERQRELSGWVFEIWKFPGEAPPPETVEPEATPVDETAELEQLPEVPT